MPYAAVYLGPEGMLGGEAAATVAGFWRAVGQVPPAEPDHLAALLGLYAALADAEADEVDPARRLLRRRARSVLLWEHLLSWVPVFARAVGRAGSAFYAGWAALLVEVLLAEAAALDPPDTVPTHLRDAPGLPERVDHVRDLAQALLTPVRSGIVLTRGDLARGARERDLGLRVGERAFVLASMLEQDATATLQWVATEADGLGRPAPPRPHRARTRRRLLARPGRGHRRRVHDAAPHPPPGGARRCRLTSRAFRPPRPTP